MDTAPAQSCKDSSILREGDDIANAVITQETGATEVAPWQSFTDCSILSEGEVAVKADCTQVTGFAIRAEELKKRILQTKFQRTLLILNIKKSSLRKI